MDRNPKIREKEFGSVSHAITKALLRLKAEYKTKED